MRKLKVFSITLVISLVFVAMAGFYGLQTAKAEDENPPNSELIQENAWLLGTEPRNSTAGSSAFSLTSCNQEFWDNGEFITNPGGAYQGVNGSALQTALGMQTYGFTNQYFSMGYHTADDFVITDTRGWQVDNISFFAYQDGDYAYPPSSPIVEVYLQIWDGPPNDPNSKVVFGDLSTNRLISTSWTKTYRVADTNLLDDSMPIMENVVYVGAFLPAGTYWLDWATKGSMTTGPWVPPVTILGQNSTGNAKVFKDSWQPALDAGTGTGQDLPFIIRGCREQSPWQQLPNSQVDRMDNVLAAYNGKIWDITGRGETGVASFDPLTGIWSLVSGSTPPFGNNYARSGCQVGNEVFVYGDGVTQGFTGLWSYNISTNVWKQETPTGTPPAYQGIWAPAWVADPATKICYLTGGAAAPGGGTLNTVYAYDTVQDKWLTPLRAFDSVRNYHAAFLFTRPSDSHKLLCVAGGVTTGPVLRSTQCYDFSKQNWNEEDIDLGPLPIALWGMGYAQNIISGQVRLWLVNGADGEFKISPETWIFSAKTKSWASAGPLQSGDFFRTSAVTLDNVVYHVGGSLGGFNYAGKADKYIGFGLYIPCASKFSQLK